MEDYEAIKTQFKRVISYSQNIDNPQVNELFDRWALAKNYFIKAFDGNLIYEFPEEVSLLLGEKARDTKINDFVYRVETYWDNYALAKFIDDNRKGVFDNEVIIPRELEDGTKIPKGMKLLRAFKYFESNKDALSQIQNEASMMIQENKISGRLCLSVHPLDYLSSSENAHNWRSCHALDGEYRSGNLSYMVDKSTIMCYLKSNTPERLPNFPPDIPWNNKKWRMLIHFSDDMTMMFAGRQYPFTSSTALEFITNNLIPKLGLPGQWTQWYDYKIKTVNLNEDDIVHIDSPCVPVGNRLKAMDELIEEGEHAMNFNDLLHSSCYDPLYAYRKLRHSYSRTGGTSRYTKFYIGDSVKCLDCGMDYITISETMRCPQCEEERGNIDSENFGYCACCDAHLYLDNAFWVHDEPICRNCFDTQVSECADCGELFYNEELRFNRVNDEWYCRRCYDNHIDDEEECYW